MKPTTLLLTALTTLLTPTTAEWETRYMQNPGSYNFGLRVYEHESMLRTGGSTEISRIHNRDFYEANRRTGICIPLTKNSHVPDRWQLTTGSDGEFRGRKGFRFAQYTWQTSANGCQGDGFFYALLFADDECTNATALVPPQLDAQGNLKDVEWYDHDIWTWISEQEVVRAWMVFRCPWKQWIPGYVDGGCDNSLRGSNPVNWCREWVKEYRPFRGEDLRRVLESNRLLAVKTYGDDL